MSKLDKPVGAEPTGYTCESIDALEVLEPVRRRPGMYLGDVTDGTAIHNLASVLIDCAVEEHVDGYGFALSVRLHPDGAITVEDDAPGLSAEPSLQAHSNGMSPLERAFTRIGVDVDPFQPGRVARYSLGAVNAVSAELTVDVQREGRAHRLHCRRGVALGPPVLIGRTLQTGTRVTLQPDPLLFPVPDFDGRRIEDRLRELAFLNPGLRIEFIDERGSGRRASFSSRGLREWVARLTEGRSSFPSEPLRFRGHCEGLSVDVALRWTEGPRPRIKGFLNQRALGRGSHVAGLQAGILRAFAAAAGRYSWPEGPPPWWALRTGLVALIDVRGAGVPHPLWRQEALVDRRVMRAVRQVTGDGLLDARIPLKPLANAIVALHLELDPARWTTSG